MSACCHESACASTQALNSPQWRRALWIALAVNALMFLAEIVAGVASGSASLLADAIDFLGDAANYAISIGVAGMALAWRARAALVKGWSLALLSTGVLAATAWNALAGTERAVPCGGEGGICGEAGEQDGAPVHDARSSSRQPMSRRWKPSAKSIASTPR